jgi:aminobenzoyl-glutamate utilization protein B
MVKSLEKDKIESEIIEWVNDNQNKLIDWSKKIWEFAEVGLKEYKSSKLLAAELENEGFEIEMGVAGMHTAFVATWGSGKPVIGILGEYDALPGLSQKISTIKDPIIPGGSGHGCGHNIYGVAAAGGAIAAKKAMEEHGIKGTIKFYGCPAEEILVGKVFMVRDGVFNDADICLTWHPSSLNSLWASSSLAMNSVKFNFYGQSAHAAANPEAGRSALKAAQLMDIGVNFLREHLIDPIRIHSTITQGGNEPNVVPDQSQIWYYIRAPHRSQVEETYQKLENIAKGAALMTETNYDINFITGCYDMLPNQVLGNLLFEKMKSIGSTNFDEKDYELAREITNSLAPGIKEVVLQTSGAPQIVKEHVLYDGVVEPFDVGKCLPGSTDVADVSWNVPTAQFTTACAPIGTPGHSWQNVVSSGSSIGQKGMLLAAKVLGLSTVELLKNQELVEQAKTEFAKAKAAKGPYKSPLTDEMKPLVH